jgi:integrase/recombinase XerD
MVNNKPHTDLCVELKDKNERQNVILLNHLQEKVLEDGEDIQSLNFLIKHQILGNEIENISAWSGSYLNKNSQELGLKSNTLAHNGDKFSKEELISIMESLFETSHRQKLIPLGDKGLKDWFIDNMIGELQSKLIRQFLVNQSKELNSKVLFQLILRFKEFEGLVSKATRKQPFDLKREDFWNRALYDEVITSKFYFQNFHIFYKHMNPFHKSPFTYTPKVKVEIQLPQSVQSFLTYKRRQGMSKERSNKFRYEIHRFFRWACQVLDEIRPYTIDRVPVTLFTQEHLQNYKNYLIKGINSGRLAENGSMKHLKNIKTFFGTLYQMGFIKNDITRGLRNIQGDDYQSRYIPTDVEIERFFEAIDRYSDSPPTDKLAFGFMLYLGFRSCELANLRWENINLSLNDVKFKAKGGNAHSLPLPSQIITFLHEIEIQDEGLVFGVKPHSLRNEMALKYRIFTKVAGWKEASGPHQLRHSFITKLTNVGVTPKVLRRLARHESLAITSNYIHKTDDEIRKRALSITLPWEENHNA